MIRSKVRPCEELGSRVEEEITGGMANTKSRSHTTGCYRGGKEDTELST